MIRTESSSGKTKLKLPPINFNEKTSDNSKERVVKKYLTIHTLKEGDFFGVGEDLKKTYIISVGRVSKQRKRFRGLHKTVETHSKARKNVSSLRPDLHTSGNLQCGSGIATFHD